MKIPAIFAIFLFTFFVGCSTTPKPSPADLSDSIHPAATAYGNKVIHLNLPNRLSMLQIQQAILNAGYQEGWVAVHVGTDGESGLVQLRKKGVFNDSNFSFLFQPTVIDGYSNSYTVDVTGKPTRRYTPPINIDRIRKSIRANLEKEMAGY
ncbi:MAG: hypothetical protein ACQKBT_09585 [Puniceicoccales bacterium]